MNFRQHVQSDRAKWAVVTVAILALAVLITGLMTSWFKDFNPYCWFGHTYDEETHVCTKCGAEEPEKTEDETESVESVIVYDFAAVKTNTLGDTPSVSTMMAVQPLAANPVSMTFDEDKTTVTFSVVQSNAFNWKVSFGNFSRSYGFESGMMEPCQQSFSVDVQSLIDDGYVTGGVSYPVTVEFVPGEYRNIMGQNVWMSAGQQTTYNIGNFLIETVSELPDPPTKTGYTFTGWYTDPECNNKYTEDKVIGNITLYAGFRANTYTIVFNANTGSGSMSNQSMTYDTAANLTANTFTKDKYTFKGWATSAGGSVEYADGQSVKNLTATDGATINLYAVWELNSYTVSFVVDGETTSTINVNIDASATLPEEPSKEGYNFIGWFLEDGTQYTNQAITADTVLTAKFEIIKCTVTFIVDGEVYARYECDYGTNLSELLSQNVNTLLYSVEGEYSPNF